MKLTTRGWTVLTIILFTAAFTVGLNLPYAIIADWR